MEKEFVNYEQSLALKELGFDEPCMAIYSNANPKTGLYTLKKYRLKLIKQASQKDKGVKAPTWQSAFRWFRDKYNLAAAILPFQDIEDRVSLCYYYSIVDLDECKDEDILCNESSLGASDINFSSHPEAELACLEKLIEIVEQNKSE